jgi:glycine cleavage system aminomethyltransferase T
MVVISPTARVRRSPYHRATLEAGVRSFEIYNQMLMPTGYGDPVAEYWRLIEGVAIWDVACERQVQITGPDAARLAQILAPRDLGRCAVGQGRYVALCNHAGVLINDPVLLKLAPDRFWLSIADADMWLWARAVAAERGLDVEIVEPDVSPLAVQGPKAEAVALSLFGDWVRELRRFAFRETTLDGIPLVVARSGWSKQGGFELYLRDGSRADDLWRLVMEAGKPWDIGPGSPNDVERIESGLLACGCDTDTRTNPFEVRLGRFVDLDVPDDTIGIEALRRIAALGPERHQLGVVLEEDAPTARQVGRFDIRQGGVRIGGMTECVWSYRLQRTIGLVLVDIEAAAGAVVEVRLDDREVAGTLQALPFL